MNNIRYTINPDGTLEKWYLEKVLSNGETALRKISTPKFNCCMRIFPSDKVFVSAKSAKDRLKRRTSLTA